MKKKATGRPSGYTHQIGMRICALLAEGISLRTICATKGQPSCSMVGRWLAKEEAFRSQYAHARELWADKLFEECTEIADDGRNDWMSTNDPDNPGYRLNGEHSQRSRLRVDTRKWMAARLAPKKYGEKLDVEHTGNFSVKFIRQGDGDD